jgi:O-antigen/teichoic acid export membrane protein
MKKYFLGSIYIYGSTIISTIAGVFRLFLIAKYLSPQLFGYWNIVLTIFGYFNFSHLGITDGLIKEVSSNKKLKNQNQLYNYSNNSILIINIIINLLSSILAIIFLKNSSIDMLVIIPPFFLLNIIYQYFITSISILRLEENFFNHGLVSMAPNLISLTITVFLFSFNILTIENLLSAFLVSYFISFLAGFFLGSWKINFNYDLKHAFKFLKIGFPIISSAFIFNFLLSLDRWVVLNYFGSYKLGEYSFPQNISRVALLAGTSMSYVFYTKFLKEYSSNSTLKNDKQFVESLKILSLITLSLIIVTYYAYPIFVGLFFEKYSSSVSYMGPFLVSVYFLSIYSLIANFFVAIDKIKIIILSIIPIFIIDLIFQILLASYFGNVILIIIIRSISIFLITAFLLAYIFNYFFASKQILKKISFIYLPLISFFLFEITLNVFNNIQFELLMAMRAFFVISFLLLNTKKLNLIYSSYDKKQ